MALDRFMIAPLEGGWQNNVRPWLIIDQAFFEMNNAYAYRGRVRKRYGSRYMGSDPTGLSSRLRITIGTSTGSGMQQWYVPSSTYTMDIITIGATFSIGNVVYTVIALGGPSVSTLSTSNTTIGAINTSLAPDRFGVNGTTPTGPVYFYPALPVMGLIIYQLGSTNVQPTIAFDTRFAYQYNDTVPGWDRLANETNVGDASWTGSDSQFFWGCTWIGATGSEAILYVTNFNAPDGIRTWDNTIWTKQNFQVFGAIGIIPDIFINTARLIFVFHNRLVLINVVENGISFVNRLRYSQFGSPLQPDSWREDIGGKGGFSDASTKEAMITGQLLKDRLIVFGQTTTWEVVYTGNELFPFLWQQINVELGAESTFSCVAFDSHLLTVGNVGIHQCTGNNVQRIDQNIPFTVYGINNFNSRIDRVVGIRDYYNELVFWTFPVNRPITLPNGDTLDSVYPTKTLIYNYLNQSWAINDDSFTFFGYFNADNSLRWGTTYSQWGQTQYTWGDPQVSGIYRKIIAGNQQGYVVFIDDGISRNAGILNITSMTIVSNLVSIEIINHNLIPGDYILFENIVGDSVMQSLNGQILAVDIVLDANNIFVSFESPDSDTYLGSGTVATVSRINILSKEYNFYADKGRNCFIPHVDFMVDRTESGAIMVEYYNASASGFPMVENSQATGAILGNNILETTPYALIPFEAQQERLWHRIYFQGADAEVIQFRFFYSDEQMEDYNLVLDDFVLHTFIISSRPTTYRLQ